MKKPMMDHFMEDLGESWEFVYEVLSYLDDVDFCRYLEKNNMSIGVV